MWLRGLRPERPESATAGVGAGEPAQRDLRWRRELSSRPFAAFAGSPPRSDSGRPAPAHRHYLIFDSRSCGRPAKLFASVLSSNLGYPRVPVHRRHRRIISVQAKACSKLLPNQPPAIRLGPLSEAYQTTIGLDCWPTRNPLSL